MNGKDVFLGLQYIGEDLVEKGAYGKYPRKARKGLRRPLVLAAMIALMLMLVGCAVAWMLKLDDFKIAQRQSDITLTLAGVQGTDTCQASQRYHDYRRELRQQMLEQDLGDQLQDGTYQAMVEENGQALAEEYGLKPEGQMKPYEDGRLLLEELSIGIGQQEELQLLITQGGLWENGNFWLNMEITFPEEGNMVWGSLRMNYLDCFSSDFVTIPGEGEWKQWNFRTASGAEVLVVHSEELGVSYLLSLRGNGLLSVELAAEKPLTEQQCERIAQALDISFDTEL